MNEHHLHHEITARMEEDTAEDSVASRSEQTKEECGEKGIEASHIAAHRMRNGKQEARQDDDRDLQLLR